MQIVESYLSEVGQYLPNTRRLDILAELRSDIEGALLDRADSMDHAPTEDDAKEVLKGFGHPILMAGRFQRQRYLIGPALYPAFLRSLRNGMVIVVILSVVLGFTFSFIGGSGVDIWQLLWRTVELSIWVALATLLVYVSIEYSQQHSAIGDDWYGPWTPDSLSTQPVSAVDRSAVMTNLISEGVFLLWWNDILVFQHWLPALGIEAVLTLTDIWHDHFWSLNLIFAASFVLHGWVLIRGLWLKPLVIAELFLGMAFLALWTLLIFAPELITVSTEIADYQENIQRAVRVSLFVIGGFALWDMWIAFKNLQQRTVSE